jgi:hypothetical protein
MVTAVYTLNKCLDVQVKVLSPLFCVLCRVPNVRDFATGPSLTQLSQEESHQFLGASVNRQQPAIVIRYPYHPMQWSLSPALDNSWLFSPFNELLLIFSSILFYETSQHVG